MQFEDQPVPSHTANPKTEPSEQGSNGKGSDLEEPPELKSMVASFLRGSLETSEDEGKEMPLEPPVIEFSWWVPWKAKRCKPWNGGPSCQQCLGEMIAEGWLGRCGHPLDSHCGCGN